MENNTQNIQPPQDEQVIQNGQIPQDVQSEPTVQNEQPKPSQPTEQNEEENKGLETALNVGKAVGKAAAAGVKTAASSGIFGAIGALSPLLIKAIVITAITAALAGAGAAIAKFVKEANELKIADTPNVVEKVKQISEFTTYTYIEEFVIKGKKAEAKETTKLHTFLHMEEPDSVRSEIVIITRGVVRAGYDLSKIDANDLSIRKDTISVKLPEAELFDIIINPSHNDVFVEEGVWSHEEVTALQVDYKNKLKDNAIASGLLEKAEKTGRKKLQSLFKTFGFNVVEIK